MQTQTVLSTFGCKVSLAIITAGLWWLAVMCEHFCLDDFAQYSQQMQLHAFGPEDELITLAVAHSLGEDEATWAWFFRNVCASLPGLCDMDCHLITDGEKGLSNAARDVLPKAYHAECAFHRSLKLSHHTTTRPLFLKMACAYTLDDYKILRERLEQFATPESIATIDAVPPNLFALHTCQVPKRKPSAIGMTALIMLANSALSTMTAVCSLIWIT